MCEHNNNNKCTLHITELYMEIGHSSDWQDFNFKIKRDLCILYMNATRDLEHISLRTQSRIYILHLTGTIRIK